MSAGILRQRAGRREWFADPRGSDRRMQVTCHDDAQRMVLSIWHGNTCAASFQLPVEDAPRLLAHVADGLADAMAVSPSADELTNREQISRLSRVRATIETVVSRFGR